MEKWWKEWRVQTEYCFVNIIQSKSCLRKNVWGEETTAVVKEESHELPVFLRQAFFLFAGEFWFNEGGASVEKSIWIGCGRDVDDICRRNPRNSIFSAGIERERKKELLDWCECNKIYHRREHQLQCKYG